MTDAARGPSLPSANGSDADGEDTAHPLGVIANVLIARQEDDRGIVVWNSAAENLLGWRAPYALGRTLAELDLGPLDDIGDEALAAGPGARIDREMLLRTADGHYAAVLAHVTASPSNMAERVVYVLWDLTPRLVGEPRNHPVPVQHSVPGQLELLQYSADVVVLMDSDSTMSFVNAPILRDAGYSDDELVAARAFDFVHPDELERVRSAIARMVDEDDSSCPLTFRFRTPSGQFLWLEGRAINLLRRSTVRSVLLTLHDVTHRVEVESGLAHRATHDSLTDLPNRVLFLDRLHQLVEHARRHDQLVAVFYWDIDHFKLVNDSAGHAVGDSLLVEVARKASAAMRAEDTVARIGGDEFVACAAVSDEEQVRALADRLLDSLVIEVILHRGDRVRVTASVGVAFGTRVDADRLITAADHAMYDAKRLGGGAIRMAPVAAGAQGS